MSAVRLFLDTNALHDYVGGQKPFFPAVENLIVMSVFGDVELYISGKSYTDAFYTIKRFKNSTEIQAAFIKTFEYFEVCSLERDDIQAACELGWPDFEDALIAVSAKKAGADYLITRDKRFNKTLVPIKAPEDIIEMFREQGITYATVTL